MSGSQPTTTTPSKIPSHSKKAPIGVENRLEELENHVERLLRENNYLQFQVIDLAESLGVLEIKVAVLNKRAGIRDSKGGDFVNVTDTKYRESFRKSSEPKK